MPRPRVKDEERKRVAKACDTCKRRKEKCNGGHPCLLCQRRNREAECTYALPRHRRGEPSHGGGESIADSSPSLQLGDALASSNDAEIAIESLLTLSGSRSAPKTPAAEGTYDAAALSHAPVPKLARLLRDGPGKFIFVGDSSNLAFLQNIRRLARSTIGESNLTTDPMRHAMIEALPTERRPSSASFSMHPKPSRAEAEDLVNHYLLAASGVVDLFDRADIIQHLASWTEGSAASNPPTDSIFYLVLAIGARNRPSDNDEQAEFYFTRGRELAVSSFMEDPSVLTVQSYILIAFYMLTACRRNGAFMLLGIAIRAAYALGLHRSDISSLFETRERRTRERVWKSLRVLDLFMSASLGRPPATSEVDGGNVSWEGQTRGYEDVKMGALHSSAMLRICFIFERILNEVYCRREVDIQLVNSISRQYRDWNMALDTGLDLDGLTEDHSVPASGVQSLIGLAHLKGAYYWSIILLTRPFLIFDVSSKISTEDTSTTTVQSPRASADTATLSEACIDAALRSIEIASDLIHTPGCPKCPFLVTNFVFVSALVVGLAMLGDYDKSFPLLSSLDQAKLVLGIVAKNDPSGRRYFLIIGYLQQAALEHIRRRDEKQLQKRRQGIHSIFGNLLNRDNGAEPTSDRKRQRSSDAGLDSSFKPAPTSSTQDKTWTQRLQETDSKRGPTLTTSGMLASAAKEKEPVGFEQILPAPEGDNFVNLLDPMGTDPMAIPAYAEEFPLFSLMNDYTEGDPFFDML